MDSNETFYRQFQASLSSLQDEISNLSTVPVTNGERQDATDHILAGISKLSNEVADASDHIPAYDQRTYSQSIKALQDSLNAAIAKAAPKQRFQFKKRAVATDGPIPPASDSRNITTAPTSAISAASSAAAAAPEQTAATKDYNAEIAHPSLSGIRRPSFSSARDISLTNHTHLHIALPARSPPAAGSLAGLRDCIVESPGFASLSLRNVERCLAVAGRVGGAAHITQVRRSILVVAARQVRMHECEDVDVYLYCGSHPIIEDCKGMRFAPLPKAYMAEGDDPDRNQWDQVDDFKWLKAGHSPNWRVLPEDERLEEEIWTKAVSDGLGDGVDDILKRVGVA